MGEGLSDEVNFSTVIKKMRIGYSYICEKNSRRGKAKTLISVLIMHKEQHGRVCQKHSKQREASRRGNQRDWSPDHIGLCRLLK